MRCREQMGQHQLGHVVEGKMRDVRIEECAALSWVDAVDIESESYAQGA